MVGVWWRMEEGSEINREADPSLRTPHPNLTLFINFYGFRWSPGVKLRRSTPLVGSGFGRWRPDNPPPLKQGPDRKFPRGLVKILKRSRILAHSCASSCVVMYGIFI